MLPSEVIQLLDPAFPYGEDLLQFIWEQGLFEHRGLRTTDGRPVEVLQHGRIQRDSGPDLRDARVRIDGQLWAGTVEVHLRSSEWDAHGHQQDAAYENVVLHVVYEHDAAARTRSGHELPTLELLPRISTSSIALYHGLMRSRDFVPCANLLGSVDHLRIGPWLERILVERLERKTLEVERLYRELNDDAAETLYHMVARAFGMKVNAEAFGMLARHLPLKVLLRYRDDPERIEALLFGQAGLLQVDFVDEHPRRLQEEHRLLAAMHALRPMPVAAWKFGRMRPMNLPTVRIAQFAALVGRLDRGFTGLLETEDAGSLREQLDAEAGPYWRTRFSFDKEGAAKPKRLGTTGMDHLLINAVVPCLFAFGRLQGQSDRQERALRLLETLPAESNTVLEAWARHGLPADTAGRGQALLELKGSYCARRRCLSCGIGNQLLKRTVS